MVLECISLLMYSGRDYCYDIFGHLRARFERKYSNNILRCIDGQQIKGRLLAEEEAYQALKTLRSSKAPLVKKRQVMRAMTGDYRQKMEEEKKKQYKLIQTGE